MSDGQKESEDLGIRAIFESSDERLRRLTSLNDVKPEIISQLKPRNQNCCAGIRHDFLWVTMKPTGERRPSAVVRWEKNSSLEDPRMRISNSLCVEEGLQRLCHQRENERGQAKAKWKNHVLVEASPTEAKEAAIDGDVEVRILEVDQHRPIVGAKKSRCILNRIHTEAGSLQPPSLLGTTNIRETKPRDVPEMR